MAAIHAPVTMLLTTSGHKRNQPETPTQSTGGKGEECPGLSWDLPSNPFTTLSRWCSRHCLEARWVVLLLPRPTLGEQLSGVGGAVAIPISVNSGLPPDLDPRGFSPVVALASVNVLSECP
eukprot:2488588-Amphidinium_carterae.1